MAFKRSVFTLFVYFLISTGASQLFDPVNYPLETSPQCGQNTELELTEEQMQGLAQIASQLPPIGCDPPNLNFQICLGPTGIAK